MGVTGGRQSPATVLEAVCRHARDRPHAPAASDRRRCLDYAGLRDEVGLAAGALTRRGIGRGDRIALHLPNGLDFLVLALAAGWVGATFVPLPVDAPADRIRMLVDDCVPSLVVTEQAPGPEHGGGVPAVDLLALHGEATRRPAAGGPEDDAYVIYTSGTTGVPKGVVIRHSSLLAALEDSVGALGLRPGSRSACIPPVHFDGSYVVLFGMLVAGGLVTLPPRDEIVFPRRFVGWIDGHAVDYVHLSPTFLRLLLSGRVLDRLAGGPLRILALGGEALSAADITAVWRVLPGLAVFNQYGPTETTICVTHHELTRSEVVPGEPVPIGRAHPGVSFHLLDDDGSPIRRPGVTGELWIGGDQLMQGYWRSPDLTARVLRTDLVPGETVYRTGDLACFDAEGRFTCLGRSDGVVKRQGTRISLLEVGGAFEVAAGVEAATAVRYGPDDECRIALFVVAPGRTVAEISAAGLRLLPATMMPDSIHLVDRLPVTSAGKLDTRGLLREAGLGGADRAAGGSAPAPEAPRPRRSRRVADTPPVG